MQKDYQINKFTNNIIIQLVCIRVHEKKERKKIPVIHLCTFPVTMYNIYIANLRATLDVNKFPQNIYCINLEKNKSSDIQQCSIYQQEN